MFETEIRNRIWLSLLLFSMGAFQTITSVMSLTSGHIEQGIVDLAYALVAVLVGVRCRKPPEPNMIRLNLTEKHSSTDDDSQFGIRHQ